MAGAEELVPHPKGITQVGVALGGQPVSLNGSIVSPPSALCEGRKTCNSTGGEMNVLPDQPVYPGGTLWVLSASTKSLSEYLVKDCSWEDYG